MTTLFESEFFVNFFSKYSLKPTRITVFSIDEIISADSFSTVKSKYKSKLKFCVPYNKSFTIIPENGSIIGVNYQMTRYLQGENIPKKKFNKALVQTGLFLPTIVSYNKQQKVLLVSDFNGIVKQFKMKNNLPLAKSDFKIKPSVFQNHTTQDSINGQIFTSCQLGNLTVLAGNGLMVMNTATNDRWEIENVKCTYRQVKSVNFCVTPRRVLLAVCGYKPNYSDGKTDLLDVTNLIEKTNLKIFQNLQV